MLLFIVKVGVLLTHNDVVFCFQHTGGRLNIRVAFGTDDDDSETTERLFSSKLLTFELLYWATPHSRTS